MIRWTYRKKAETLQRLDAGEITAADLAAAEISADELAEWRQAFTTHGAKALRTTKLHVYETHRAYQGRRTSHGRKPSDNNRRR